MFCLDIRHIILIPSELVNFTSYFLQYLRICGIPIHLIFVSIVNKIWDRPDLTKIDRKACDVGGIDWVGVSHSNDSNKKILYSSNNNRLFNLKNDRGEKN